MRHYRPGTHTIKVTNSGEQDHEVVMVQLPPDKSIQDFLDFFAPDAEPQGPPPGLPVGGVQPIAGGAEVFFDIELAAGKYGIVCFVDDPESGAPHFALGMVSEFEVQ